MQFDLSFFIAFVFKPPPALLMGLVITIAAAVISMFLGVILGGLLAIAGLSRIAVFRWFNQIYISFFRGTPVLVQLMLVYFGAPYLMGGVDLFPPAIPVLGFVVKGALVAGIVAFSLHEAAYMSEITRAGILAIDTGQIEAAKSLGMSPVLAMRRIVLPQAFRVIIPPLGNQFNIMFKTTSLLSVIAVPEMFHVADAIHSATYRTFEVYLGVSVYYLALTGAWTFIQQAIEKRFARGYGRTVPVTRVEKKLKALSE
jgi:polar amino acid transport system permease protein